MIRTRRNVAQLTPVDPNDVCAIQRSRILPGRLQNGVCLAVSWWESPYLFLFVNGDYRSRSKDAYFEFGGTLFKFSETGRGRWYA